MFGKKSASTVAVYCNAVQADQQAQQPQQVLMCQSLGVGPLGQMLLLDLTCQGVGLWDQLPLLDSMCLGVDPQAQLLLKDSKFQVVDLLAPMLTVDMVLVWVVGGLVVQELKDKMEDQVKQNLCLLQ